jgi:hypothetical protein
MLLMLINVTMVLDDTNRLTPYHVIHGWFPVMPFHYIAFCPLRYIPKKLMSLLLECAVDLFMHHTPQGVTLDFEQYDKLKDVDKVLPILLPELKNMLPCQFTHQNVEGAI